MLLLLPRSSALLLAAALCTPLPAQDGAAAVEVAPARPFDGFGLLLNDGTWIAGNVEELDEGGVQVTPEGGTATAYPDAEVAMFQSEYFDTAPTSETPVALAWRAYLVDRTGATLLSLAATCAEGGLVETGNGLLEEARGLGLPEDELAPLAARLGKAKQATKKALEKRLEELAEQDAWNALLDEYQHAASFCLDALDAPNAAGALFHEPRGLGRLDEGGRERLKQLALETLPADYPYAEDPEPEAEWPRWADALLPLGARFISNPDEREDSFWKGHAVFETPQFLLRSRTKERDYVIGCLSVGKRTVETLDRLLGVEEEFEEPFRVQLLANLRQYEKQGARSGLTVMPWAAGHYAPALRVTQFYVPRKDPFKKSPQASLERTMSHEMTHQYLAERWLGSDSGSMRSSPEAPGYWIVEGFARFMEDQLGAETFDPQLANDQGRSFRVCQALRRNKLMRCGTLIGLTQVEAQGADYERIIATVILDKQSTQLSAISRFYEQSATLVYFLLHGHGEETRAGLLEYMRLYYQGRTIDDPLALFGFESANELDDAFHAYLASKR